METNIILCGVGGQGVIFLSSFLSNVALNAGYFIKQSEIHGMSQRGGAVVSHLRISNSEIFSPIIPKHSASIIISLELLEIFRYLDYLNNDTKLIVGTETIKNFSNYPNEEDIKTKIKDANGLLVFDSNNIKLGGVVSNMLPIDIKFFEDTLEKISIKKGTKMLEKNKTDFYEGRKIR